MAFIKWSRVFDGLLPALSGVVNSLIDDAKLRTYLESPKQFYAFLLF